MEDAAEDTTTNGVLKLKTARPGGWFQVWRQFESCSFFKEKPFCPMMCFIDMVGLANFRDTRGINGDIIRRGSFVTSQNTLAARWGLHRSKVQRFIARCEREQAIEQHTLKNRTTIVMLNYDDYQTLSPPGEQPHEQLSNHIRTGCRTAKEEQDQNNINKIPPLKRIEDLLNAEQRHRLEQLYGAGCTLYYVGTMFDEVNAKGRDIRDFFSYVRKAIREDRLRKRNWFAVSGARR